MKTKKALTIGVLAKQAGVGIETVKFYERRALLPKPAKPLGGFRTYPPDFADRIKFIKRAQELGFTLREVQELLKLKVEKTATCNNVMKRAENKIFEIDLKIKDLKKMKRSLEGIRDCCEDGTKTLSDCPILDCF
jgi:MerR family mercuric resistance operon transcriptional regulator